MKLRNDKIVVFGGSSGIGKAVAKRFTDGDTQIQRRIVFPGFNHADGLAGDADLLGKLFLR